MILIKIFVLRPAGVLRSGHLLLYPAAEDQYVEGGARLGESADLCVRAVVSLEKLGCTLKFKIKPQLKTH